MQPDLRLSLMPCWLRDKPNQSVVTNIFVFRVFWLLKFDLFEINGDNILLPINNVYLNRNVTTMAELLLSLEKWNQNAAIKFRFLTKIDVKMFYGCMMFMSTQFTHLTKGHLKASGPIWSHGRSCWAHSPLFYAQLVCWWRTFVTLLGWSWKPFQRKLDWSIIICVCINDVTSIMKRLIIWLILWCDAQVGLVYSWKMIYQAAIRHRMFISNFRDYSGPIVIKWR